MKKIVFFLFFFFIIFFFFFFNNNKLNKALPILGSKDFIKKELNGKISNEVIYHTISYFNFIDQFGSIVDKSTFNKKIYISNFFFTTCPTICPILITQMLRVYYIYKHSLNFKMISHSIDSFYDNVNILRLYSENIGLKDNKIWHFITGNKSEIYEISQKSYYVSALEDSGVPGGIIHGGTIVLVDNKMRIRGFYDGTQKFQVNDLIEDIDKLLK